MRNKYRYPKNWLTEIRPRVLVRDNFTCQHCGVTGGLQVAHLDQNPANNDMSNLRLLCPSCHLKFDTQFRIGKRRQAPQKPNPPTIGLSYLPEVKK